MKYLKMIGLAAVAAMALMAFFGASSASAAVLCKTHQDHCSAGWDMVVGDDLTASLTSGKEAVLKAAFAEVNCKKSHVGGEITDTGGNNEEVVGHIDELSFTECKCNGTREAIVTVLETGSLSINDAGTVTSTNTRATIECVGLAKCIFGTVAGGTDIGQFTESVTGSPATTAELDASAALTYFTGDSSQFVCSGFGHTGSWTAEYQVTSPDPLYLAKT